MWPFKKKVVVEKPKVKFKKHLEPVTVKVAQYEFSVFLTTGEKFTGLLTSPPFSSSFKAFDDRTGKEYPKIAESGYLLTSEDRDHVIYCTTYHDIPTDNFVFYRKFDYYYDLVRFKTINNIEVEFSKHLIHHFEYSCEDTYVDKVVYNETIVEIKDGE